MAAPRFFVVNLLAPSPRDLADVLKGIFANQVVKPGISRRSGFSSW